MIGNRYCSSLILAACLVTACAHTGEQERALSPGRYCMLEPLVGHTGTGRDIPLGKFLMAVTIKDTPSGHAVSFWNVMPDSEEVLQGETKSARLLEDGSLTFSFVDGWSNRGHMRVRPNGEVELVMTHHSGMNQIGRNYGTYTVSRQACAAPEFQVGG